MEPRTFSGIPLPAADAADAADVNGMKKTFG